MESTSAEIRFKKTTKEDPRAGFSTCSNVGRWAVEQGRRKLYLRVVGMLLGGHRRPGSAHTAAASKWRRPYRVGAWSERTAGTADRDVLPQHRRTERRCTSSLSASGRDAAGSLTNAERERPRRPCVRWCDERQTHFSIFPTAIVLYSVRAIEEYITLFNANASSRTLFHLGVVPDPPSSKQPLHASNYHVGCLFV